MNDVELRELDAWIAEHVMGWNRHPVYDGGEGRAIRSIVWMSGAKLMRTRFKPTTDKAAAMEVLEKCIQAKPDMGGVEIRRGSAKWIVESWKKNWGISHGETLPIAICLFAKQLFTRP